mgnify:CR=1 FL=1
MNKYIELDTAITSAISAVHDQVTAVDIVTALEEAPTADVVEVVHGEWIKTDKGQKCSNCNCLSSLWDNNLKTVYCPWRGAKMDGERKE